MKRDLRQIPKHQLDALVSDNIRLRAIANRIWLRWYFVPILFAGSFAFAYAGAMFGAS
jgi:hypothetical protein